MKNIVETINYLVDNFIFFAVYSLPNSQDIFLIIDENKGTKKGFVIQSFDKDTPKLVIGKDVFLKNKSITLQKVKHLNKRKPLNDTFNYTELSQIDYKNYVNRAILFCQKYKKVVPSRIKILPKKNDFNIGEYFLKLFNSYENTFVNLFFHECGLWMGATPELLVKEIDTNVFETYSLAGTKLISEKRDWILKEIQEQQIVSDYIIDILSNNQIKLTSITKATDLEAGSIMHLISKIQFQSNKKISEIAKILHPTPAVCGLPSLESYNFILKNEGTQRKIYTGFIGLNFSEQKLFVNLRCMQIIDDKLLIYVGGGVTVDSIPKNEWVETENKSQTLISLLD